MTTQVAAIVGPQAQKSLLTIQKATVKKQLLAAEFSEQLTLEAKPRAFTMQGTDLVHPDLERCFAQLVPHFCLLTEQLSEEDYTDANNYWPEDKTSCILPAHFNSYGVTGIIIGTKNGVTLMGYRTMTSGKVQNMTAQYASFTEQPEEFEEADVWHYQHTDELRTAVADAITEIEAALRGKCSEAGRQLQMFAQEPEREVEFGEATQELPAKKRKANRVAVPAEKAAQ